MIDKTVLLFKQDLEDFPTSALKSLQRYLHLPDTNREDLVWLIAIHQAQKSQKAKFPIGGQLSTITAGDHFSAGILKNRSVFTWGYYELNRGRVKQLTPPDSIKGQPVMQVAAGSNHLLALLEDHTVVGWGDNRNEQTAAPDDIQGQIIQVAAGDRHSLALLEDRTVVCWGDNQYKQCDVPDDIQGKVIQIDAGSNYSLALLENGDVFSWGDTPLGIQGLVQSLLPILRRRPAVQVAAGDGHVLVLLEDGDVVQWGSRTEIPTFDSRVVQLAAGGGHSLALLKDHSVVSWGGNRPAILLPPRDIQGKVVEIAAGGGHSVALLEDGHVIDWGDNQYERTYDQEGPFLVPTPPMIKSATKR